jgi:hypothetical protein
MLTIFHNVQYVGLVWVHNRNRYRGPGDFGPARAINRSLMAYLLWCLSFSLLYLMAACATGVFPGCGFFAADAAGSITPNQIGLCLWWGLALQHYYLDQKIWRIRADPALKRHLGLG